VAVTVEELAAYLVAAGSCRVSGSVRLRHRFHRTL